MKKKMKFLRYAGFLLIILPALLGSFKNVSDRKPGIGLQVLPAQPLIEMDAHGQYLNFDVAIANKSSHELAISALQVSVFDKYGKLLLRKFINSNGQAPSINLLGKTTVKANETIAIFNPLFSFAPGVPLYRLKYEIFFNFQDSEAQKTANSRKLPFDFDTVCTTMVYPHSYPGKTSFTLPLKGRLIVWDGHDFFSHHRRFPIGTPDRIAKGIKANSNRYAYDFIPVDNQGNMYKGDPFVRENWFAYSKPIYAPAGGVVISAVGDIPDNVFNAKDVDGPDIPDSVDPLGMGNHIIIDHGDGEYSVLLHMKKGSVRVKTGDKINQGQLVGEIGFSGDAICPHLHYTVMSGPTEQVSEGVPSNFNNYKLLSGSKAVIVGHGRVDSGDLIESSIK